MMMKLNRREWGKLAIGGLAAAVLPINCASATPQRINSRFNGVLIGAQSYSFRDRPLDEAIKAMREIGIGSCELWQGHVEPQNFADLRDKSDKAAAREALRRWRLGVSLDEFANIRRKFDRAGIDIYAYNLSFRDDFTDAEIERGFEMAKALGAKALTSSSTVSVVKRVDAFAQEFKMRVGMHNHSNLKDPNEFAAPESFMRATEGASDFIAFNLDIGHFTAANFNAVDFLRNNHARIVTLHIKDRKRNQGDNVSFGQGDAPIRETLALLRDNKWDIPANIEYEYKGGDTVEEVRRCFDFCKQALGAK